MNAELGLSQYAIGRGPGKQHTISAVTAAVCGTPRAKARSHTHTCWVVVRLDVVRHRPQVALQDRELPRCRSRPLYFVAQSIILSLINPCGPAGRQGIAWLQVTRDGAITNFR